MYQLVLISTSTIATLERTTADLLAATASPPPLDRWQQSVSQLIDGIINANYTNALLLVTLAAIGALVFALWILLSTVKILRKGGRRK